MRSRGKGGLQSSLRPERAQLAAPPSGRFLSSRNCCTDFYDRFLHCPPLDETLDSIGAGSAISGGGALAEFTECRADHELPGNSADPRSDPAEARLLGRAAERSRHDGRNSNYSFE